MAKPIELYFWPTPNGLKVSMALLEMGLPYEIKPVNIGVGEQFKPDFLAISPNNRMPAMVDPDGPDGQPLSIFESGAILQYLGRKSGKFYPQDERGRAKVDEWLFWQMAGLGPMSGQAGHFRTYAATFIKDQRQISYGANRYTNEVDRLWGVLEKQLDGRDFIAGDYSIADMACWPWMRMPAAFGLDLADFPNVKAWSERIAARPATIKAVEEGERIRTTPAVLASGPDGEKAREIMFGQRARR